MQGVVDLPGEPIQVLRPAGGLGGELFVEVFQRGAHLVQPERNGLLAASQLSLEITQGTDRRFVPMNEFDTARRQLDPLEFALAAHLGAYHFQQAIANGLLWLHRR